MNYPHKRRRIEWIQNEVCGDVESQLMQQQVRKYFCSSPSRPRTDCLWMNLPLASVLLAAFGVAGPALSAQVPNSIQQPVDSSRLRALPNHHPLWASPANSTGAVPDDLPLDQLTLVVSRSPQLEQAFQQFLAGQQNPASPDYHHWLTPAEVGQRFGLSDQDIAIIQAWLRSEGLRVNWVSPSRVFIGFGGTAADLGRAFHTELHYYSVRGAQQLSVSSEPMIPAALLPTIKAIRGLYAISERPTHHVSAQQSASPQLTSKDGSHYITPNDFNTIYDVPASLTGAGVTIGIIGWSRTNPADFDNFKSKTGATFTDPTEVIPTAYGGIEPGPALTAPPSGSGSSLGGQLEATLDVLRTGSVAPAANLLLVVSSQTGTNDGIGADAQYLVNTSPVPAEVMSISFGACESEAGPSGVTFWDSLFQTAAAEGISVFVSSGDSGASGCDSAFSAPPASPSANSPNYICSSSYATCVGGTQFADSASLSTYWSSTNGAGYLSALGYIPEGAWNESTSSNVAATGGGASTLIATPPWQTGAGVPSPGTGRYTPDVSFSASAHDGYFACMAATSGSCVSSGASFSFIYFSGTSAAAPGMAGVAALLDQKIGTAQGNLNPGIYALWANAPNAFHDATVASSGVGGCSLNTASICNNSIPNASGSGAQAGFQLGPGYDQATGLGSLDVLAFLNNYATGPTIKILAAPPNLTFPSVFVGYPLTAQLGVQNTGSTTLNPVTIAITGANAGDFSQTNNCQLALVPASACSIQVTFKPGAAGIRSASMTLNSPNATNSPQLVSLSGTGSNTPMNPPIFVNTSPTSVTTAQALTATVSVIHPSAEYPTPTGSIVLSGGGFTTGAATLSSGNAFINIPAGALSIGDDTLTAVYTPDSASSALYNSESGSTVVPVTGITKITPTLVVTPSPPNITTAQSLSVTVGVGGGAGNPTPAGSVTLTSGSYASAATTLSSGSATINVLAGSLATGTDALTVVYTPDSSSSSIYLTATGANTVVVSTPPVPSFTVSGTAVTIASPGAITGNTSAIAVAPSNGFTGSIILTAALASSPSGAQYPPTFSFGVTSPVSITSGSAGSAILTVSTTASQSLCTAANQVPRGIPWYARGGAVLAGVLLFAFAPGRRKRRAKLGMLILFFALAAGMLSCGGSMGTACNNVVTPGTTTGTYNIILTGTSNSTTATNTVTLTVN